MFVVPLLPFVPQTIQPNSSSVRRRIQSDIMVCLLTLRGTSALSCLFLLTGIQNVRSFQAVPRSMLGTQQRRLARSMRTSELQSVMTSVAGALDSFCQTSPYAAAGLICGFKASAADLVAQKRQSKIMSRDDDDDDDTNDEEESSETTATDYQRNLAFILYGSLYQGMTQEFLYNHMYPVWFGSGTGVSVVLTKVVFDLLIQTTLFTLPIAYLTKALIFRYSFQEGLKRYVDDVRDRGLLLKYFSLWGPVQCLTFGVVPEHLRVPFIAFVSFFWLIILSSISSRQPKSGTTTDVDNTECLLEDGLTCDTAADEQLAPLK